MESGVIGGDAVAGESKEDILTVSGAGNVFNGKGRLFAEPGFEQTFLKPAPVVFLPAGADSAECRGKGAGLSAPACRQCLVLVLRWYSGTAS